MASKNSKVLDVAAIDVGKPATKYKPPNAGKGRVKGVPNKTTKALKEMILGALDQAGGEQYLLTQAKVNPGAFMSLIGKVLPTELKNADAGGFVVHVTTGVPRE